MLYLRKDGMYYCPEEGHRREEEHTAEDRAKCVTPKIQKERRHTLENWLNMYPAEINFIVDHYLECVLGFSSNSYSMSLNINQLRKDLIKIIYLTSDNRRKSFAA
jgi:hypothetical protein